MFVKCQQGRKKGKGKRKKRGEGEGGTLFPKNGSKTKQEIPNFFASLQPVNISQRMGGGGGEGGEKKKTSI